MNRPDAERDAPAAAPGAVTKAALRVIDASLNYLQRLRGRFAPPDETDRRGGRQSQLDSKHAAASEEKAPSPKPSFLRLALVGLICLLVGGGVGALLSYRELSHQLSDHAGVVERMQEELDATRKEEARNIKLLDKFQRENAEYRREARDAEREAEAHRRRAEELEAQIEAAKRAEEAKRAELAARQAKRAAASAPRAKARAPQKTGDCAVGTAGDLSNCIEEFNR